MKKYKLSTFKDVFNQIPLEKVELCMHEIALVIIKGQVLATRLDSIIKKIDKNAKPGIHHWPNEIEWIDDGK